MVLTSANLASQQCPLESSSCKESSLVCEPLSRSLFRPSDWTFLVLPIIKREMTKRAKKIYIFRQITTLSIRSSQIHVHLVRGPSPFSNPRWNMLASDALEESNASETSRTHQNRPPHYSIVTFNFAVIFFNFERRP